MESKTNNKNNDMEINTIKINKEKVYVIFTGMQYHFSVITMA